MQLTLTNMIQNQWSLQKTTWMTYLAYLVVKYFVGTEMWDIEWQGQYFWRGVYHKDGLVQERTNSSVNAVELLQPCTKSSI